MSDSGTFLERFKRQAPLEFAYEVMKWIFAKTRELIAALVATVVTGVSGWFAYFSSLDPLIMVAALTFTFVCVIRAVGLILEFRPPQSRHWGSPWGSGWSKPSENTPRSGRPVEFVLPSNWEPGFNKFKNGSAVKGAKSEKEEIRLQVIATEKMENVRLEIEIHHFIGSPPTRETAARFSSSSFSGVVPKGTQETLTIMHRSYWITSARFNHPQKDGQSSELTRVENEVLFFPGTKDEFKASLGEEYIVTVKVLHDDGPDEAQFTIQLRTKVFFPQSMICGMQNIAPLKIR